MQPNSCPASIIRFAAYEVDLRREEVRKHGVRIKVQDQPFKVLAALLERPGETVTRDELRQRIWGDNVFVDFEHRVSAAVNRLREALCDSAEEPRYIETVARRGYRFIAPLEGESQPSLPATSDRKVVRWLLWTVLAALALVIGGAGVSLIGRRQHSDPPRLVQITAEIGSETMPALSPDGRQVAFVWNGEKEENADVYVRMVNSENTLRLTSNSGADLLPSWSPDGSQIAFVRVHGATEIYLVSPLGGKERKLIEFPGTDRRPDGPETRIVGDLLYPLVNRPSWSPDGRFLVVTRRNEPPEPGDGAVLLVPVDGGHPRPLLVPPPGTWYKHAAFSPDGRRLVTTVNRGGAEAPADCQLQVFPLTEGFQIHGTPATITKGCEGLRGLAWMPDGQSIVLSGFRLPHFNLWRLAASPGATPERIELAGADALWPSVSQSGGRLAFARSVVQADLWRLVRGEKAAPFLSSTARDTSPQFSPDGTRIAFQSARAGPNDIWLAQADGSELTRLTAGFGESAGSPAWAPDGQRIAFDAVAKQGGTNIWSVDTNGGPLRQLTFGPGHNAVPTFSRNGAWIYFYSDRSGDSQIWRVPSGGGSVEQVTSKGGFLAMESTDGQNLFYTKSDAGNEGVFSRPVAGGEERRVVSDIVVRRAFAVASNGLYFITPRDEHVCELRYQPFNGNRGSVVSAIARPVAFGLSVSPDERTFLFSRPVTGADLMMIENFR